VIPWPWPFNFSQAEKEGVYAPTWHCHWNPFVDLGSARRPHSLKSDRDRSLHFFMDILRGFVKEQAPCLYVRSLVRQHQMSRVDRPKRSNLLPEDIKCWSRTSAINLSGSARLSFATEFRRPHIPLRWQSLYGPAANGLSHRFRSTSSPSL
jgi:hypothetical protein